MAKSSRERPSISGGAWNNKPKPIFDLSSTYIEQTLDFSFSSTRQNSSSRRRKLGKPMFNKYRALGDILAQKLDGAGGDDALTRKNEGIGRTRTWEEEDRKTYWKPMMVLIRVLFPDPLGPRMTWFSPSRMTRLRFFRTGLSAIETHKSVTSSKTTSFIALQSPRNHTVRRGHGFSNTEKRIKIVQHQKSKTLIWNISYEKANACNNLKHMRR